MQCNFTVIFMFQSVVFGRKKSLYRDQETLLSDCNHFLRIEIWNNRKSSDFLHYVKFEFLNA